MLEKYNTPSLIPEMLYTSGDLGSEAIGVTLFVA